MDKSAGIEIENIPSGISREDLVTLFERELKDENEIKYILFPLPENRSSAFVCFKQSPDKAFIERLMARNPVWRITVDSRMQTYCCCTAEVDALIVATLPDIPACIEMLERDYGIEASYDDVSGKFLLKGTMHQLQCAQVRLDSIFREQLALQKLQLIQIGSSNDTSVKRSWLDEDERREVGSSAAVSAGKGHPIFSSKEKYSAVVDDQFEDRPSRDWKRYTTDSDYRSLPASSSLHGNRDSTELRTRLDENEPKSSNRTQFLSSRDHEGSNRADGPVSLPHFSDARHTKNLPRPGDRDRDLHYDRHSRPEHMRTNDWRSPGSREPTYASVLNKNVDAYKSSEPLKSDWHGDKVYAADPYGIHREYESTFPSKSRVSPLSDLVPSRESVDPTSAGWRISSMGSERAVGRDDLGINKESSTDRAFWKERLDINSERLHSLPVYLPEAASRHHPKAPEHGTSTSSSKYMMSDTADRQYLTEYSSDKQRGFSEDIDEPIATSSEEQKTLFLETYVVRYIMAIERLSISGIKQRYRVQIEVSTEEGAEFSMVGFTGHPAQAEKASKKFAELYEEIFNCIIQREVSVRADYPDVIERVQKMYRIIAVTDVAGTVTLVGEFGNVMKAVDMLNSAQSEIEAGDHERGSGKFDVRLSSKQFVADKDVDIDEPVPERRDLEKTSFLHSENSSGLARRSDKSPDLSSQSSVERSLQKTKDNFDGVGDVYSASGEPRSSAFASMLNTNRYTMTFKGDFPVFVYAGDITKLRVDAIVNAANSSLKNYSGVAGAIENAGGAEFKKGCDDFYLSHGPLQDSEVAHTAATGDLRCRDVIHAVGPMWFSDSDEDKCSAALLTTFENVLNYAEQTLEAESVALPAVGTGIFGVPVDLCARAIYGAINEFLERSPSVTPTLRSIHVVNKDPGTTELIQAVFEGLRQVELEEQMKSHHRRSPSGEERLSETSARRPCSERKLVSSSISGKDKEDEMPRVTTELKKKRGSNSGSDIDESYVVQERVGDRKRTGPAETTNGTLKKDLYPNLDSDSDEF